MNKHCSALDSSMSRFQENTRGTIKYFSNSFGNTLSHFCSSPINKGGKPLLKNFWNRGPQPTEASNRRRATCALAAEGLALQGFPYRNNRPCRRHRLFLQYSKKCCSAFSKSKGGNIVPAAAVARTEYRSKEFEFSPALIGNGGCFRTVTHSYHLTGTSMSARKRHKQGKISQLKGKICESGSAEWIVGCYNLFCIGYTQNTQPFGLMQRYKRRNPYGT